MDSEFWKHMECLVAAAKIVIDRPRDSFHPRFQNISYPIDYGYLEGTKSSDGAGIDVWNGSESANKKLMVVWSQLIYERWTAKSRSCLAVPMKKY